MLRRALPYLLFLSFIVTACDCGDDPGTSDDSGVLDDASVQPDGGDGDDRVACNADGTCEGGEVCGNNGLCCPMSELCGGSCCVSGEACEGALCRLDCGSERSRCGDGSGSDQCCAEGELCVSGSCFLPSSEPCRDFVECPAGQYCEFAGSEDGNGVCLPQAGGEMCAIPPEGSDVEPTVAWRWPPRQNPAEPWSPPVGIPEPEHVHVMMAPMVANLTDDNGNGIIDEDDIPDVVFNTFSRSLDGVPSGYGMNGILRIISGDDGSTIHSFTGADERVIGGAQVAIADLDGDGFPEIVTCSSKRSGTSYANMGPLIAFTSKPRAGDPSDREWQVLWRAEDADGRADCGQAGPAIADLDGDGNPEVMIRYTVVSGQTGAILAHEPCGFFGTRGREDHNPCDYTTAADLDLDGELDIVGGNVAFRYTPEVGPEPGEINFGLTPLWDFRDCDHASADPDFPPNADPNCRRDGYPAVGDFDLDGWPEVAVIESGRVYPQLGTHHSDHFLVVRDGRTGALRAPAMDLNILPPPPNVSHADECKYFVDGEEIAVGSGDEPPPGAEKICLIGGGGPPTIANFDPADPEPEIAVAGAYNYAVFNVDLGHSDPEARITPLWAKRTFDHSSRKTGSSVFDFDGDGAAEVVYNDQEWLRIYDGATGETIFCQCNFSATLWEYPIVVDVDNDGHSEIVVATNAYEWRFYNNPNEDTWRCNPSPEPDECADAVLNIPDGWRDLEPRPDPGAPANPAAARSAPAGISVYKGPGQGWIGTRRIWNQHTYHVTNITELGRVPARETTNWTQNSLNNFRLNVQPGATYQPDVKLRNASVQVGACGTSMTIYVEIHNAGWAAAPIDFPVSFYELGGDEAATLIGTRLTERPLFPGETRLLELQVAGSSSPQRQFRIRANDPGDEEVDAILECRDDGKSLDVNATCFNLGPG